LERKLHLYKYIVDGEWKFSPDDNIIKDADDNLNNCIDLSILEKKI